MNALERRLRRDSQRLSTEVPTHVEARWRSQIHTPSARNRPARWVPSRAWSFALAGAFGLVAFVAGWLSAPDATVAPKLSQQIAALLDGSSALAENLKADPLEQEAAALRSDLERVRTQASAAWSQALAKLQPEASDEPRAETRPPPTAGLT